MEEKKWKPENGEMYWYVWNDGSACWGNFTGVSDERRFKSGNCFKTEEEAKAAAEKVKALLLSLHGECENLQPTCNQLATNFPKLTAEVFDRPDCPEWAKIAVVNRNGKAYYGRYKDARINCLGGWRGWYDEQGQWKRIGNELFDASDWRNSLVERPAKNLSDWFKVGELVAEYDLISNRWEYGNIYAINGHLATMENGRKFHFRELLPARLRPWTFDELPVLPVEIKGKHGKLKTFISMAYENKVRLGGDISFVDNKDLIDEFLMIDGSPCGVLEHLKNGEWVK